MRCPLTQPAPAPPGPRVHSAHAWWGRPTSAEQWLLLSHCCVDSPTPWWDRPHPRSEGSWEVRVLPAEKPLPQAGEGGLPLGRCITGQVCLESRLEMQETSSHGCRAQISKSEQPSRFTRHGPPGSPASSPPVHPGTGFSQGLALWG